MRATLDIESYVLGDECVVGLILKVWILERNFTFLDSTGFLDFHSRYVTLPKTGLEDTVFEVDDCPQNEYDLLRMMGRHRRSLTLTILKAIGEDGSIEWEDHSYSTLSDNGELLHPTFGFLKRLLPYMNLSFKDYFVDHPVQNPLKSLWDGIGKTSSGTIVLLNVKSGSIDSENEEQLNTVAYLASKGVPVKYVDLILINDSFLNQEYEKIKNYWTGILEERNTNLAIKQNLYFCFMAIKGSYIPREVL